MKEIVSNLIKEAAYHKAAYENTMRYLDGGVEKTASPLDFLMDGMSPASLDLGGDDWLQQARETIANMGNLSLTDKAQMINGGVQDSIKNFLDSLGGLSPTGKAMVINDSVQDAINEYLLSKGGLSPTGAARVVNDSVQDSMKEFVDKYLQSHGLSIAGKARVINDSVQDSINDYSRIRDVANGIKGLGNDALNTATSIGKGLKNVLSDWGSAMFGSNEPQTSLADAVFQNGPITDNGGSSALVRALSKHGPVTDNGGSGALARALSKHGPIEEFGPSNDPYAIFNSLQNNWKNGISQHDKLVNRKLNISAWMDHMMENNTPGMDTFKNFIKGITGKDLGVAAGAAGLGGLGIAASRNLQNSNNALAQQNSAIIKDLQTKLQQQLSQNNSLTANLGARLRNAGNSALQAIKNNPKTSLAIGAGAAGLAALPFLLGGSEKKSSYDPYKLQMLRNALINMR